MTTPLGIISVPPGTSPVAIVRDYLTSVFVALWTDPPFSACPPGRVGSFTELGVAGYQRAWGVLDSGPPAPPGSQAVSGGGTAVFGPFGEGVGTVNVTGWIAGVPLAGGGEGLLAWGAFDSPAALPPGRLLVPLVVTAASSATPGNPDAVAATFAALTSQGVNRMALMYRGKQRNRLRTIYRALQRVLNDDAAIPSLKKSSIKGTVPVLPTGTVDLQAMATSIVTRIGTVLNLTR